MQMLPDLSPYSTGLEMGGRLMLNKAEVMCGVMFS